MSKKVDSMYDAIDAIQLGIDEIQTSNIYRDGTNYQVKHYKAGMELLTEVRDFLLEVKITIGDFTVNRDLL